MQRLGSFQSGLAEYGADAAVLSSADVLSYFTGYYGSGLLCIDQNGARLYTYYVEYLRARDECRSAEVEMVQERPLPEAVLQFVEGRRCLVESRLPWPIAAGIGPVGTVDALLAAVRARKTEEQIADFETAVGIALDAYDELMQVVRSGMRESEVAAILQASLFRRGAQRLSFDTIVASGPRTAYCHGVPGDRMLEDGDLCMVDMGPVFSEGEADITRTFAVGQPSDQASNVYEAVHGAQAAAIGRMLPGAVGGEVDAAARGALARAGLANAFGHALGHSLRGGPHMIPNGTDVLVAAAVVTVEPGVYLPGWGGVRIEDDVLVQVEGPRLLGGRPAPARLPVAFGR